MNLEDILATFEIGREIVIEHVRSGRTHKTVAVASFAFLQQWIGIGERACVLVRRYSHLSRTVRDVFQLSLQFLIHIRNYFITLNI